jgi:purine-binding chemotaxis protein CheW
MSEQKELPINKQMIQQTVPEKGGSQKISGPSQRCVLFGLEDETYGLNVSRIKEVLRVGEIRDIAGNPPNVLGVINVRGVIVTVIDVRGVFRMMPKNQDDLSRIIIVELEEEQVVGLMVDSVIEVKDIPEAFIEPVNSQENTPNKYIRDIASIPGEEIIILIELDRIFPPEDF